jgi:hypothetical protein
MDLQNGTEANEMSDTSLNELMKKQNSSYAVPIVVCRDMLHNRL